MIIPHLSPTVSQFINENQSALTQWFNEQFKQGITIQYADHLLVQIHQTIDWTPLEQACAHYHDTTQQRAPILHAVSHLLRALVVKYLYGWSYRQTEDQIRHHLLVRWFVGHEPFAPTPDHTTLHLFALWLEKHQAVALGMERPKLRNQKAIANQNTLIYLLINLRAMQRLLTKIASSGK